MKIMNRVEFDYNKDKRFEEKTNKFHIELLTNFLSKYGNMVGIIEISDKETQKRGIDLRICFKKGHSITIELKTDRHLTSPNIFLEDISNTKTNAIGWTMKCESTFLSYGFYNFKDNNLDRLYLYKMQKLKDWFKGHYRNYEAKFIKNKEYYARGRAIPTKDVKDFLIKELRPEIDYKPFIMSDFF